MIIDYQLQMSSAQAVTASAASTNVIDSGADGDAYGRPLWFILRCVAAATAAGAATVDFQLQTSDDPTFGTGVVNLIDTGALAKTALTANTFLVKQLLPVGCLRYLRTNYTVATGPLTAGTFDAMLVPDVKIGNQ